MCVCIGVKDRGYHGNFRVGGSEAGGKVVTFLDSLTQDQGLRLRCEGVVAEG